MTQPIATVKQCPLIALIIDMGRNNAQHLGFTPSGPLDWLAFQTNALLLGNSLEQAQIECVLGELVIEMHDSAWLSAVGKDIEVRLNSELMPAFSVFQVQQHDQVSLKIGGSGNVGYLGVKGGFDSPVVKGSRCTVLREVAGGLSNNGDPLTVGNELTRMQNSMDAAIPIRHSVQEVLNNRFQQIYQSNILNVIKGNQVSQIGTELWHLFLTEKYSVSTQFNRMGYKLSGNPLPVKSISMRSEGMTQGAIQVPPDGQPIVMMADHQTLGGYPKIGTVALCDLPRLSQASTGTEFSFESISPDEARYRYRQQSKFISDLIVRTNSH